MKSFAIVHSANGFPEMILLQWNFWPLKISPDSGLRARRTDLLIPSEEQWAVLGRYENFIGRKSAAVYAIYQLELLQFSPNQQAVWHRLMFLEPLDAWLNGEEKVSGFPQNWQDGSS